jgi:hypothetical protein
MRDPKTLSDEEIDRILSSSSGNQEAPHPSTMSDDQIDSILSQFDSDSELPTEPKDESFLSALASMFSPQKALEPYAAAATGAGKGLLDIGRGAGEAEAKLVDLLAGTQFAGKAPRVELPEAMTKLMERHPIASTIGEIAGESVPLMALPEAAFGKIKSLEKPLSKIPFGRFGGRLAKGMGVSAALEPLYEPEAGFIEAGKKGAPLGLLGPVAEGATGMTKGMLNYLQKMGGFRTSKGAQEIMDAAENLDVSLPAAEVIGSKGLKTLQQTLGSVPGTGMPKGYDDMATGLNDQISSLLHKLNPDNLHSGEAVKDHLVDKYNSVKNVSNELYSNLRQEISEKAPGLVHDNSKLFSASKDISDEFKRKLRQPGGAAKVPKDVKDFVNEVQDEKYSLIDAIEIDENINSLIGDHIAEIKKGGKEGQQAKRGLGFLKKIKESNYSDIENTIEKADVPEIKNLFNSAKDYYKKEMVPFVEKGSKLHEIMEESNPDKIQSKFLTKSGEQPKDYALRKVTDQLPQDIKDMIAHKYLIGAKEDPTKVVKRFSDLQPKQQEALFSGEDLNKLKSMETLKKHFGGEFDQMFSPKTGYIMKSTVPILIAGYGYNKGGYPGAMTALAAAGIGGKAAKELLMSDAFKRFAMRGAAKTSATPEFGRLSQMGLPIVNTIENK